MFTTGSKLFLGGTVLSAAAAIVWAITTGGEVGWTAVIGLLSLFVVIAFLAGLNFYLKDGNVRPTEQGVPADAAVNRAPVASSAWPAVVALGVGVTVVGAETYSPVFQAGIVLMLVGGLEWMFQAWSERASSSTAYNAAVRKRVAHPLEFPVFAAVLIGVLVYSFSRIMLGLEKEGGRATFFLVAAIVLLVGFLAARSPGMRKGVVGGVAAIGLVGLVGVGVGFALRGEKTIAEYPTTNTKPEICEAPGELDDPELREIDERASQNVSNTANVAATVVLEEGDVLEAFRMGSDEPQTTITLSRSTPSNILFRNEGSEPRRFTIYTGSFPTGEQQEDGSPIYSPVGVMCTSLVEEGGEAILTVKFPKSNVNNNDPEGYRIEVPGVEAEPIAISVP
jgi:hypothetical protein